MRYVVGRSTLRPVRAEYRLPSGKVATIVEFAKWSEGRRPYASRLLIRDALHGGATTAVDVLEVEERPVAVPDGLFDAGARPTRHGAPAPGEAAPRSGGACEGQPVVNAQADCQGPRSGRSADLSR